MRLASNPNRWRLTLARIYLISTAVLAIKMAPPMDIRTVFKGEREVYEKEVPSVYTFIDTFIMAKLREPAKEWSQGATWSFRAGNGFNGLMIEAVNIHVCTVGVAHAT